MAYNALKVPLFGLNSGSFGNDLNGMQRDREGHSVPYSYCHVFAEKALSHQPYLKMFMVRPRL